MVASTPQGSWTKKVHIRLVRDKKKLRLNEEIFRKRTTPEKKTISIVIINCFESQFQCTYYVKTDVTYDFVNLDIKKN